LNGTPASACWATALKAKEEPAAYLGELLFKILEAQAELACADALDQLGGGGDRRLVRPARVPAFLFS
jgi:hypothetical protein